jgi:hypothetical protein
MGKRDHPVIAGFFGGFGAFRSALMSVSISIAHYLIWRYLLAGTRRNQTL